MFIKTVVVGPLQVNCVIIADEASKKALVIDPGDEPEMIMDVVSRNGLEVQYIICTHGHFDHVGAVVDIKNETGAKVVLHKDELGCYNLSKESAALWGFEGETQPAPDMFVKDGDVITAGALSFKVLHTPGHSLGGICLYSGDIAITGDTLFAGSVGRSDLPGGDINKLGKSFRRLMELPGSTKFIPGHGPSSSIGHEKKFNMFSEQFLL
ncbi:MAG: MBL fold metallo-hydrolase [Nitrospirae bacterium]|nr:MAG: MBL fold metallo-hydrolase [Nitrospirota bacterium]